MDAFINVFWAMIYRHSGADPGFQVRVWERNSLSWIEKQKKGV